MKGFKNIIWIALAVFFSQAAIAQDDISPERKMAIDSLALEKGNETGKADTLGQSHIENTHAQRAGLGHKSHFTLPRHSFGGKSEVVGGKGIQHADAVWPHNGHIVFFGNLGHFAFQAKALTASFPETGRDDNCGLDLVFRAILKCCHYIFGRDHYQGQINRLRNLI